ncbi:beta-lactamase family protein [Paenibacillus melissococcoides]|uniref:Beta-lactamase family protein n=1 Tax=Paenibacillus melissococcoides TaxID=2912268 RepID=A0ABN8U451_9BACL|nr:MULTISPECIES: serine hydrolase domain-containing protein [Paenibacillus]MEB9896573.1 serine hydrolase [Bacillus cereus]CAH8244327.1 beta-lactamase family protein [Paenibacillus melissococcoides]CAH8703429.1 beta-lactamase family protein [Paenibacillus melissococcoides]CAH8705844.1 beta-lactamase family protein [Paenibacillus melissococcoides]GIO77613.1 hypothetical protein J6TS7_12230 [Paenibacillus dendritiformis]
MGFNSDVLHLVEKNTKKKKRENMLMTIGFVSGEDTIIKVYDHHGEMKDAPSYNYEIGSVTKTFTTSLMAKFASENRLDLNDSIQKYLKDLPHNQYYPTLKRLATHTSGYSSFVPFQLTEYMNMLVGAVVKGCIKNNPFYDKSQINWMSIIQSKQLKDQDYKYAYSNFGISILGHILSLLANKNYSAAMDDFIANDLGLSNTYVGTYRKTNLHGYNKANQDCGNWQWGTDNFFAPSGAITSTAEDLLLYVKHQMGNEKPYLSLCHQKHAAATKKFDIGLGWEIHKNSNLIYKDGGTGCFTSYVGFEKSKRRGAVVLSNYLLLNIAKIGEALLTK